MQNRKRKIVKIIALPILLICFLSVGSVTALIAGHNTIGEFGAPLDANVLRGSPIVFYNDVNVTSFNFYTTGGISTIKYLIYNSTMDLIYDSGIKAVSDGWNYVNTSLILSHDIYYFIIFNNQDDILFYFDSSIYNEDVFLGGATFPNSPSSIAGANMYAHLLSIYATYNTIIEPTVTPIPEPTITPIETGMPINNIIRFTGESSVYTGILILGGLIVSLGIAVIYIRKKR